jgi:signal transduction histidine kinase/Fe-S-cluster-containing hydrogenase component 2
MCYTCVRECPAKAIRIAEGQAEVLTERCIACGNCVRVCCQRAKKVHSATYEVHKLLAGPHTVAAVLAPSFPAEFTDVPYERFVGMLRKLGFDHVNEVAFGADLVADRYQKLLAGCSDNCRFIATSCPAIVSYIEKYHPSLVANLAPIVSPMIAIARVLRKIHGPELKIVFVGPCIAKKGEQASVNVPDELDAVLTFTELRDMFEADGITPATTADSEFDPPHAAAGALFSISRGLLQAASIHEDLISGEVIATDGAGGFVEALKAFSAGDLDVRLLEVLCCKGCIMGAGMSTDLTRFSRRSKVSQFVRKRITKVLDEGWQTHADAFDNLDLSRNFEPDDQRIGVPFEREIEMIMARMGKSQPADELNCGACGYATCREHAIAIFKGLAESEMCLPYTIEQLRRTIQELAQSNEQLASTQEALMHSERLASMGQLAAGIAHEVNNPLGVVLMYAHLLLEEVTEDSKHREDLSMIAEQADRCKGIVAGLLNFARQNKVNLQDTNVKELVDRALKAITHHQGVQIVTEHDLDNPIAEIDADQMVQVLTNLLTNAIAAMPDGGTLTLRAEGDADNVRLVVADTGTGIPEENLSKIFEPFFTTKQIGKGTGLGLAVTYGVVKMHRGDIRVESNTDPDAGPTGTTFTVTLPRRPQQET